MFEKFKEIHNSTEGSEEKRRKNSEVFTPDWLVDDMCKQAINQQPNKTLDLCAGYGQFTIGLLRNGLIKDLSNHTFVEKDPENQSKLKYIFGDNINLLSDYTELKGDNIFNTFEPFDLCITNPPYNSNIDLKVLTHAYPLCKELIAVHPSTWILDRKMICKRYVTFRELLKNDLRSVRFFNGNPVFDIGLFVPCMITHIDKSYKGKIQCDYFGDIWEEQDIFEITKFGSSWHSLVKPFFEQIKAHCAEHGSIWDMRITELPEGCE